MKKIILSILALFVSLPVLAGSVSIELQDMDTKRGVSDMRAAILTVRDNITKNVFGDIAVTGVKVDSTQAISNRVEGGVMVTSDHGLSLRVAVGERYTGQTNYAYYSINPSFAHPIGKTGFVGSVGWRWREAFDDVNNDQTKSWRVGLAYNVNKTNTVGVAYYKVNGTIEQNIIGLNYTRRFK
jgi:hypothetical protein